MMSLAAALAAIGAVTVVTSSTTADVVKASLNGLELQIDSHTGGIVRMEYAGVGLMLDCGVERAGAIDLAYPTPAFEALRLASRYSAGARVTKTDSAVVIYWDKLGLSRAKFDRFGDVSATVRLAAAEDGRSVIMSCDVTNNSTNSVRQVVFPDLAGLLPFAGADKTLFKCAGFASTPFIDLRMDEWRLSTQYMVDAACSTARYQAGGLFQPMIARWLDFGSLSGGFSLFPKRWGWDPQVEVMLQLSEVEDKLRMLCLHDVMIKPGEKWESGQFVLTPHTSGWAKGIEPFRDWARSHIKRDFAVPRHVRNGLGYRTVWMCQTNPEDPLDAIFTFKDLPKLARECKENGLDEMVIWAWCQGFTLPLPGPFPHLGSERDLTEAVRQCKQIGVNVAPFISVIQANPATAPRYGAQVTSNNGWTYHTELIPRWNPPYATAYSCVQVGPLNPKWQQDVLDSCKHLVDIGIASLSWDQYWSTKDPPPNMNTLSEQIRAYSRQRDPESTFSGEELWNFEIDSAYLDYTWNWGGYRDIRPLTSVFPAPRVNCCISQSPLSVKNAFADNMYLNIFPRKHESVNGSDYIANYPEMSKALKQCAALRKRFLKHFTDGTLIGECILTQPSPAHVSAYVLPESMLVIVVNQQGQPPANLACDLAPWLPSKSGRYVVKFYGEDGILKATTKLPGGAWNPETGALKPGELAVYEIEMER